MDNLAKSLCEPASVQAAASGEFLLSLSKHMVGVTKNKSFFFQAIFGSSQELTIIIIIILLLLLFYRRPDFVRLLAILGFLS